MRRAPIPSRYRWERTATLASPCQVSPPEPRVAVMGKADSGARWETYRPSPVHPHLEFLLEMALTSSQLVATSPPREPPPLRIVLGGELSPGQEGENSNPRGSAESQCIPV